MLSRIFPFLGWLKGYNFVKFKADAIAGLTVALVLIPQSMAYAQLAGLPAYYGLYASFLPPMIAALFGSSRQLATGPVAVVSLMTAASLGPLATAGSDSFIAYAILLALIVGAFQFLLGVLKLGLVVNFLSHPVVNGFTNAAAIIIATSQLSKMFGVSVDSAAHHYETIFRVIQGAMHYTHWPTLIMGIGAFMIMYVLKKVSPKIPNVLVAVALTTVISWAIGFEHNVKVDVSKIDSLRVKELITSFNKTVGEISVLAKERAENTRQMEEAQKNHDKIEILNLKRNGDVLNVNMEELKVNEASLRKEIRDLHFSGVKQPDDSLIFYLKDEMPQNANSDGRIWRIQVGTKPIQEDSIRLMGGGAVVGVVPKGLPSFTVPPIDFKGIMQLLPYAVIISLLGFMEAISIAKALAGKTGQRLDPNQELIGQGLANMLGSIGKSYPVSGSFSRSAVNFQAGALTGFSSAFTSIAVLIMLLFLTPLLYHLPQSVLAAVIMMAVIGLLNVSGFIHAWRAQKYDGIISVLSFIATLAFAPHLDKGIMIGVALSISVFLYNSMKPKITLLAKHDDQALRCIDTHSLQGCEYISIVQFEGPLFFANASYLEDSIRGIIETKKNLKHIILVANGINEMDASGEETLSLLVDRIRSGGLDISLSGVNETVLKVIKRTHLFEKIGQDHMYHTPEQAIRTVYNVSHKDTTEKDCPLLAVCRA
ncbi:MAG TPA: SulP family inorganic anion transporter [Thermodesulfovibrionales bacterium]|jgi:anti-anti-sigma factor|nr:SulP family inorganic anion transporter [Thermodesulfovibrionales bacterium]